MNALARDWQLARARAYELLKATFNEADHPRDEHGRWTDGGGGDVGGSGATAKPKKIPASRPLPGHEEYTVTHKLGVNDEHHYELWRGKEWVGEARLSHTAEYVVDLGIKEDHRGQGLATALYDVIESDLGHSLKPSPTHQTEAGQEFWRAREEAAAAKKESHPGKGYSKNAKLIDGVIHTSDVYDAARALHEDRPVELDQPRTASILIDKLGEITKDMIAKGEKAPHFNLCRATIKGTSLFCADTAGIPRVQMPQIPEGREGEFREFLAAKGYEVSEESEFASYLRATQNELNGAKVAGVASAMREDPSSFPNRLFVSRDNYILDGHHRWAAKVGIDAQDNVLGNNTRQDIVRVDISITQLLKEADEFTGGAGKLSATDEAAEDQGIDTEGLPDPNAEMTPEQEAAARAERLAPQNVAEYEKPKYIRPDQFASEAEYKQVSGALRDYKAATGDGDAYAVNRTLRGKEEMTPRIQQAVDNIDLAFKKTAAPIFDYNTKQPKEAWLYRGISNRHQLNLKAGDEFADAAFGSTSTNGAFATEWARFKGPGGQLVKITVPAGTKVLPLRDSSGQDEGEVMLNRGTRFRVTEVAGRRIYMTVIA